MTAVLPEASGIVSAAFPPTPFAAAAYVLMGEPAAPGQFLVDISAYKGGVAASGGLETVAEIAVADLPIGSSVAVGTATLRYADRDWTGAPGDTMLPNIFYEGRVTTPLVMDAQAPVYPETTRRVQRQFGLIEIINSDGAFDRIIQSYSVDGRQVQVRFGPWQIGMADYSEFAVIADMVATAWTQGEDIVTLSVQDPVYNLDLPIQTNLYGGTGGADGTSDIQGKPKPIAYGQPANITPAFIDPLNLIYQVHDGQILSVDAVYDRGGALTLDPSVGSAGDVATYADLVSATVSASMFATCLAEGLFKLGSSPAGVITADVHGAVLGGGYSDAPDRISLDIFENRSVISSLYIDEGSFIGAAAIAGPVGIYLSQNDTPTATQVLDMVMGSFAGWWGAGIDGKIRASRLLAPENTAPEFFIDQYDVLAVVPEEKPIPRWRQRVAWGHNFTVQRGEDLDVSVTDAKRAFLVESDSIVTSADATLRIRHLVAQDPAIAQTYLVNQADAQTVADYLLALHGVERQILRITTKRLGMRIDLGKCLNFTYPRFGLNGGKNFIVVGRHLDMDKQEVELRLWG